MERQELLNELLSKEMERLRKICFKYQRRKFLLNKVEIVQSKEIENIGAAGTWSRKDIKDEYKFTHLIQINSSLIDVYYNSKKHKKFYKKQLVNTISHELVHAMCYEEFEGWVDKTEVSGTHKDGSPIFLSCLWFLTKNTRGHDVGNKFKHSKVYQQIKNFKKWGDLRNYCFKLMLEYSNVTQKIKSEYNKQDFQSSNIKMISNNFEFSAREFGLCAVYCNKAEMKCESQQSKLKNIDSSFEIGAYILPMDLEKLFIKKINNSNFKSFKDEKFEITEDGWMINLKTKEKIKIEKQGSH